ncbi:MAG TPA: hypothetical protein VHW73_11805 [Rudaea sp.]|jgi:hypothetical protein|nr:hypothetical protein [Rudaea sp.]
MDELLEIIRGFQSRTHADLPCKRIRVAFDETTICVDEWRHDERPAVTTRFAWESIRRICFKDNGPMASDVIYLFVAGYVQALAIPLESDGGGLLWRELRARGIFPRTLHEQATLSTDGRLYCWPPVGVRGKARR